VVDERLARLTLAGDDVQHSRREAGFGREPQRLEDARARVLGRLQDDRVPRGERRRERVHGQEDRRVPRDDDPDDAERLAERVVEDARPVERDDAPLDLVREPAEVVEPVRDHPKLREHLLVELAVVGHLDRGDLLRALRDQVGEAHHQPAAPGGGEPAPGLALERGRRGADGAVDVLGPRERVRRPDLPGRGVDGVVGRARGGVDVLAADEQGVGTRAGLLRLQRGRRIGHDPPL
jgi:hypothetical protein